MGMLPCIAISLILAHCLSAHDIVFSPVLSLTRLQQPQPSKDDDGIDIATGSEFNGLTTFANLPYAKCFADSEIDAYDVAILGSPFDTVSPFYKRMYLDGLEIGFFVGEREGEGEGGRGRNTARYSSEEESALVADYVQAVTARPGARFGPTGIRQGSRRMSASSGWSIYTGRIFRVYPSPYPHPPKAKGASIARGELLHELGQDLGLRGCAIDVP